MLKLLKRRPQASVYLFVLCIVLGNLVLYQKPLLEHTISVSASGWQGWVQILSTQFLQIGLLGSILLLISTFSIVAMKVVASVFAFANASALYFMVSYNMLLDRTMIANILGTNSSEAGGLWHPSILPYLMFLGVLPTVLIWWTKVYRSTWIRRALSSVAVFVSLLAWLFATSATWLWYDQHATELGSKILPWSYVVNTARYYNREALDEREQVLLPDAAFETDSPKRKMVVVLVMGEAARAANFARYGYDKDTNPFTAKTSLTALPAGLSCATNTISSTACILTHEGSAASSHTKQEPLPSYLTRQGIETIYRTNSAGPPPVKVTTFETTRDIADRCEGNACPQYKLDEVLNWKLAEALKASTSDRIFVTMHQTGSHGPAYHKQYPAGFDHFQPECKTVQIGSCSSDELYNSYDNTIRYTDHLLADLIAQLKTLDADSVMIYVSDHGQSLGENGFYLHGAPNAVAPNVQREVPFLVWMSEGFKARRALSEADIIPEKSYPHDFPFHSVMGAFGMRSPIYKPEFDIFSQTR